MGPGSVALTAILRQPGEAPRLGITTRELRQLGNELIQVRALARL
jgi:hypothetical protein